MKGVKYTWPAGRQRPAENSFCCKPPLFSLFFKTISQDLTKNASTDHDR